MKDAFDYEHIAIVLNSAHKDYHLINQESEDYCHSMFSEVLSNALTLMMLTLKDSATDQGAWDDIVAGINYEAGSIADAMHYFITVLEWNTDNLQSTFETIHRFIDENLKGDTK